MRVVLKRTADTAAETYSSLAPQNLFLERFAGQVSGTNAATSLPIRIECLLDASPGLGRDLTDQIANHCQASSLVWAMVFFEYVLTYTDHNAEVHRNTQSNS